MRSNCLCCRPDFKQMLEKLPGPTDCMKKALEACERQWFSADTLPVYCTEDNSSHVGFPFCSSCMGDFDVISLSLSFYQYDWCNGNHKHKNKAQKQSPKNNGDSVVSERDLQKIEHKEDRMNFFSSLWNVNLFTGMHSLLAKPTRNLYSRKADWWACKDPALRLPLLFGEFCQAEEVCFHFRKLTLS